MSHECKSRPKTHPRESANILSLLTFFYTLNLFKRGYRKDLDENDLYQVLSKCESKKLGEQLEAQWEICQKNKSSSSSSLMRALWACFGKIYIVFGIMQLIMRTILVITIPEALGKLISYFAEGQTKLTRNEAYYYASLVIGLNIINSIYTHNYLNALVELGIRVKVALCSLIYRKSLKLSHGSLEKISIGQIVTLMTKDVAAFEMMIFFGNDIWIGFVQTAIICYLIYHKIGSTAFAGTGFFLAILPLQILIGKFTSSFRKQTNKKTDERLQATQETLSFIKIIKMYTWETFFEKRISNTRKKEVNAIHKIFYMKIIIVLIGILSSKIAFFILIMTYVWSGNHVTAEIVYFITACFGKLRHLLNFIIPLGISYAAELLATVSRIKNVLDAEELQPITNITQPTCAKIILKDISISINNIEILKSVSVDIEKGLHIVVGHTGSGKTVFLKTILQEIKCSGDLCVWGKISYAPQEPWLFPSTIRNNILFGEKFNLKRYQQVVSVCALDEDFKAIGDETVVGDQGVNLSKGQQARISLARAVYRNSDIYLFDDCLSSLDASVSGKIFNECINGFLHDKLIVFVTNNYDHINQAYSILKLEDGSIKSINKIEEPKSIMSSVDDNDFKEEEAIENIYREKKESGKVAIDVYKQYIKLGGGFIILTFILLLYIIFQTSVSYTDKLVSNWVTLEQNLSSFKDKTSTEYMKLSEKRGNILNLYTIMVILSSSTLLIKAVFFFNFARKASINFHKMMISNILNATMEFFDSHLIGNILNRFSKDLYTMDEYLPFVINDCLQMSLLLIGVIFLIATVNPLFLIPSFIFFGAAYFVRNVYQPTGRNLQRLEASTRSPVIGHLKSTLDGLTTIRAFKAQDIVINEFDRRQDLFTSAYYCLQNSRRALAFSLEAMCSVFITIVISKFLFIENDTTVGNVGLAITQAFSLAGHLQHAIKRWADFENDMTSVERILEYSNAPQENRKGTTIENWPQQGSIKFENVSLQHRQIYALKNISFTIAPREKIGIVGRTGAGKSSIISALFNLYPIDGKILIDNEEIGSRSLKMLRSNMTLIPQDPILFSGTIRENIDPLKKYTDAKIWGIIEILKLKNVIKSLDNTPNLSAGQKQLVCLGRAILSQNKIVVLDEITANLDDDTDNLIKRIIEDKFSECTVLIVAHRLNSILKSDRIMVVNQGKIIEFDTPNNLLNNENSVFYKMMS